MYTNQWVCFQQQNKTRSIESEINENFLDLRHLLYTNLISTSTSLMIYLAVKKKNVCVAHTHTHANADLTHKTNEMARANKPTAKCCWCFFLSCFGEDVVSDENRCHTPTKKLICLIIYFRFSSTNSSKFSKFHIAWMRCRILCSVYRGLLYSQMHAIKIVKNGTHASFIFHLIF